MKKWSKELLIAELKELGAILGRVPTSCDMSKYHRETGRGAAHSSYCDYFGSWELALKAAGYDEARYARYLSDEVLCEQLRRLAKELGHTPLRIELDARRSEYPCSQTYYDRFGSWREALDRAGLVEEYHYRRDMSDEDLLEMLRRLAAELGRVPSVRDLKNAIGLHLILLFVIVSEGGVMQ